MEYGFSLAGAAQRVKKPDEVRDAMYELRLESDVGLVVIDERLMGDLEEDELSEFQKTWEGMLVVLPAPKPRITEEEDYAAALIRRTIGYHLRLKR